MKQILVGLLMLIVSSAIAQKGAVEEANELVENKKYESAINLLNEADPANENPDIVLAKTNLFLKYFATSMMHQMFAVTDLEPDQDILDVRGTEGSYSMFAFSPDSVLNRLIETYPEDYRLHKELGFYYHEVHLKYQGQWLDPDSVLVDRFVNYYQTAYDHDVYDYWSAYGIGYGHLMKGDYEGAIPYLVQSTELKEDYPSSHYNLAYAYLCTDQREKGIESAKRALDLYEFPQYKADAARMIAVVYQELKMPERALEYYQVANKVQPDDYYTLKPMLDLEVRLNTEAYPNETKRFFLLAPENPTIYQDLMAIYMGSDKPDELIAFLSGQHAEYSSNDKVNANLYFYKAVAQYEKEDYLNSKENFETSRRLFANVFEPDHEVFKVIDSYTNEIE